MVPVILDCEIGRTLDNVLTLGLLYGLSTLDEPEAEVVSVSLTRSNMQAAAFVDAVGRYYAEQHLRDYPERFRRYKGLAPGLDDTGAPGATAALPGGYPHEVRDRWETADPLALIRNALTAQEDGSAVVVLAGAATNLAGMMGLNGAVDLIRAKAKQLVVAMDGEQLEADRAAAETVLGGWPTPVVTVAATDVRFPADAEFSWTDRHPIADVLGASNCELGTRGLAAALFAVRPGHELFGRPDPARLDATNPGLAEVYRQIVTAQPSAREPRRR